MKFLLTIWADESTWSEMSPEEARADLDRWFAYTRELEQAGVLLGAEALEPTATGRTYRPGAGVVTDGPFAETAEQLAGFYLLECADIDEAVRWGRKIPMSAGSVELRPVMDFGSGEEAPGAERAAQA
jgi:hypothetical protein